MSLIELLTNAVQHLMPAAPAPTLAYPAQTYLPQSYATQNDPASFGPAVSNSASARSATYNSAVSHSAPSNTGQLHIMNHHVRDVHQRGMDRRTAVIEVHLQGGEQLFLGMTTEPLSARPNLYQHGDISVWIHPHDPHLPGLELASTPGHVQQLLGPGCTLKSLQTMSYRPLRRAVLRADVETPQPHTVYLKALPTGHAHAVYQRHQLLRESGVCAAAPVAEPVQDVLGLHAGTGRGLAALIMNDGAAHLDPDIFVDLLRSLPDAAAQFPRRPSWSERLESFIELDRVGLPEHQERLDHLYDILRHRLAETDPGPWSVAHGDFYEAHVLISNSHVSTLLDVDSLGPGYLVDDLACMLGHLAVLPSVDSRYRPYAWEAVRRFFSCFAAETDPATLATRAAAVAVSLVPPRAETDRDHQIITARLDSAARLNALG